MCSTDTAATGTVRSHANAHQATIEPVCERRLADGRVVRIRPICAADAAREREFLSALSGESRYLRFHQWVAAPSERLVHFLTEIDHDRHVAFVCAASSTGGEDIVGEGRFIVGPDGRGCEFGIVIADQWHKTGIAGLLMAALIRTAQAKRLETMEGEVLRSNTAMLRFARALGFEVSRKDSDAQSVRVIKRL